MNIGLNATLLSGQPGYRSAGIHRYIDRLLEHLPAAVPEDWRLTAYVSAGSLAEYPGIRLRQAPWDTASPLRRILHEQVLQPWALGEFDLFHALAFVGPALTRTPLVVTVYDLSFVHYPESMPLTRRLYLRLLTGRTCRRARRVLAISQSTADDLTRTFGIAPDKVDVAICGHDADVYHPLPDAQVEAFRAAKGLPERFWLFLGTIEPRKNLVTLFEAYAALPEHQRLPLLIGGGKGWQTEPIFAAVERLGLSETVRFTGFIPSEELPLWYNSAEVFVFPSIFEGFGLPVLEAMACGTPVIVSNASSLPEVAGNAGLCLPPRDVNAWRDALQRAYDDADWRAEAAERGLTEAARFTWTNTAAQTARAYQKALNGQTP
jgi:glycosyltransferase involved in cell wall biosynthesis